MPPLFILVFASLFLFLIFLLLEPIVSMILGLSLVGFTGGFILILFLNRTPSKVMQALPKIPLFIMGQVAGLLKIRKANKDFLATSHKEIVEIDEIWENRKHEFDHLTQWEDQK